MLRALSETSPDGAFTEAEGERVWQWAEHVRIENALLDLVLTGWLSIKIREDGQLVFRAVDPKVILAELERQQTGGADPGIGSKGQDQKPPSSVVSEPKN